MNTHSRDLEVGLVAAKNSRRINSLIECCQFCSVLDSQSEEIDVGELLGAEECWKQGRVPEREVIRPELMAGESTHLFE